MKTSEIKIAYWAAMIAAVTFILYLPALRNGFVNWDDYRYVKDTPEITMLDRHFPGWVFTTFKNGNWHPLTWLSFALDYRLWGLNPLGYHLQNVVLHVFNVFIVVMLVFRLKHEAESGHEPAQTREKSPIVAEDVLIASVAGILFGLHPLRVESVAWISERKDVLCGLFYLLSLLSYYAPAGNGNRPRTRNYLLSLLFFICALMSKPMAVTLPLVIVILDIALFRKSVRDNWPTRVPFFMLSLLDGIITLQAQSSSDALHQNQFATLTEKIINAINGYSFYVLKTIHPVDLSPLYPLTNNTTALNLHLLASSLFLSGITAGCIILWKKGIRSPLAVWASFGIMLLPVIGVVAFGEQAVADRYTYLPGICLSALLAAAGIRMFHFVAPFARNNKHFVLAVLASAGIVAALLSGLSRKQITVWHDSRSLWERIIAFSPNETPTPFVGLGYWYLDKQDFPEALQYCGRALSIDPDNAKGRECLAEALLNLERFDEAIRESSLLLAKDPRNISALQMRGIAYMSEKQYLQASDDFMAAFRMKKSDPATLYNLAVLQSFQGNSDKACIWLALAVQNGFANPERLLNDPGLQHIRREPCYQSALSSIGGSKP